ncbi:MAG: Asp-tRNA(Asn)/Glu-tRNA(Gln) amidotransferase subunit GatA, partial [Bacillota bacterium]|nr:Asp-tRNA(Asn)/Glu-tRNA(Gln) amidotransferase subunit GatA [Bacillota bacterium]
MGLFENKMSDLHERLHKKELSVSDLVDESFKRIAEVDGQIQAFLTLDEEG